VKRSSTSPRSHGAVLTARGEVIFHQGDEGSTLFILEAGRVKIDVDAESGNRALISILGPGESFGELALIDSQPRSATIEALEPVEALILARADFMPIVLSNPRATECLLLTGRGRTVRDAILVSAS
jgi:CRP-like cAMP-binding protein